jgi:hypothetical protein
LLESGSGALPDLPPLSATEGRATRKSVAAREELWESRETKARKYSNINVTPMVDVMLVLLIIFMVITPMLQKDVSVNLAE